MKGDKKRLEFLIMTGNSVSWICSGARCYVFPLTDHFDDPRAAIDEAIVEYDRRRGLDQTLRDWREGIRGTDGVLRFRLEGGES